MRLLKAVGGGLAGAVLGIVAFVLYEVAWVAMFLASQRNAGSGGIGAVSIGILPALPAALVGFILAFVWQMRRSRQRRTASAVRS